jgi:hypothetical protein
MEVWNYFRHREWWLRRYLWWFTDNLSGFGTVSEIFVQFEIHFEKITGVILTTESHGWLPEFSKCAKTPKMHLFVLINIFFVFSLFTEKHTLNIQISFRIHLIQVIRSRFVT